MNSNEVYDLSDKYIKANISKSANSTDILQCPNSINSIQANINSRIKTLPTCIIYKGWILTYQENSLSINQTNQSCNLNQVSKWVPKFAVIIKPEKSLYLFDNEPNPIDYQFLLKNIINIESYDANDLNSNENKIVHFRLDNSIKKDSFISFWQNKFVISQQNYKISSISLKESTSFNNNFQVNNLNSPNQPYHHHLSNKDIESLDKDSLSSFSTTITNFANENDSFNSAFTTSSNAVTSGHGTFRFAGLFFKKDKIDKSKHSSLKRAKSGIQLERKKPSSNNLANSINQNDKFNKQSNEPDNRQSLPSLPSPIRPSRSHESLASPLRTLTGFTHSNRNNSIQKQPNLSELSNSNSKNELKPNNNPFNTQLDTVIYPNAIDQNDFFLKLNLNPKSDSNFMNSHFNMHTNQLPVFIHSIHTSLLNEENCFEIKSVNSIVNIHNAVNIKAYNFDDNYNQSENNNTELYDEQEDKSESDNFYDSQSASRFSINAKNSLHMSRKNFKNKLIDSSKEKLEHIKDQLSRNHSQNHFYVGRYFMCRSSDERDNWLKCIKNVFQPNLVNERHEENSLQVWILEAKGQMISSKSSKKYFCEIFLDSNLFARTCCKDKKDILFWGESFDFNVVTCENLRIDLYQDTIESSKKKSKKEKENLAFSNGKDSSSLNFSNRILLGYIYIPVNEIQNTQPIEKWYRLVPPSTSGNESNSTSTTLGLLADPLSSASFVSIMPSCSNASITTQNFGKDSISIRIKAKYQKVDILPLDCYQKLIEYLKKNYLKLILNLEPLLSVRIKDDIANSLVRIAHKLQMHSKFLCDVILAEVLQLEDSNLTFRGNSLATKSMESYMKLVGENYLKQTLSDCVRSIIDTNHDLEIDPSKVSNQSSLQGNREELVQILHLVCGRVFNSCVNFPKEIKEVFVKLRNECIKNGKTDEMCDTLISASIFLRFICPAILSPNLFNLTQEYPQEKAARKLTLAAKTLQTIANFSKFGAKEFYMSFDKMNQFVDEHTCLMREFLRNISTYRQEDIDNDLRCMKVTTLMPQTPNSLDSKIFNYLDNSNINGNKQINELSTSNNSFHSVINQAKSSININYSLTNMDTFDLDMIDLGKQLSILHNILNTIFSSLDEITKLKFDGDLIEILNEISSIKQKTKAGLNNLASINEPELKNNNQTSKLYLYENRLHLALMKNQQQNQENDVHSPSSSCSTTQIFKGSKDSSLVSPNNFNLIETTQSSHAISDSDIPTTKNFFQCSISNSIEIANLNQKKLQDEIYYLKEKLKETEIHLKKEQTEKYLIEYKFKQHQEDNNQQMKNIINRLIRVEEELRKEQNEMHKLLKSKQELIEIQKKRIEYLTSRGLSGSNKINKSYNSVAHNLSLNHPSFNYHQHVLNPKLKNRNQSKLNNTSTLETLPNADIDKLNDNNSIDLPIQNILISNSLNNLTTGCDHLKISTPIKSVKSQIAASPSTSSSSMTQFCNSLAEKTTNNFDSKNKLNLCSSYIKNLPIENINSTLESVVLSSASSSSSSSATSTLSNLNNNHSSANFLRTSEL